METVVKETYFKVMSKTMSSGLADHFKTSDDAIIAREEARQKQIKAGYTPEERIIVVVQWVRRFDENGVFISECHITRNTKF